MYHALVKILFILICIHNFLFRAPYIMFACLKPCWDPAWLCSNSRSYSLQQIEEYMYVNKSTQLSTCTKGYVVFESPITHRSTDYTCKNEGTCMYIYWYSIQCHWWWSVARSKEYNVKSFLLCADLALKTGFFFVKLKSITEVIFGVDKYTIIVLWYRQVVKC